MDGVVSPNTPNTPDMTAIGPRWLPGQWPTLPGAAARQAPATSPGAVPQAGSALVAPDTALPASALMPMAGAAPSAWPAPQPAVQPPFAGIQGVPGIPGIPGIPTALGVAIAPPVRPSRFRRWRRRNAPKYWWKVLLLGFATFLLADMRLGLDANTNLVPLVILLASAVVPVTFVVYLWERGAFAKLPASVAGLAFVSGAVVGLLLACSAEDTFLATIPLLKVPVAGMVAIGVIEESAKALSLIWFVNFRSAQRELDGLVLGAAAGMGFATLETAGYGFSFFLVSYTFALKHSTPSGTAFVIGLVLMTGGLLLRMALAAFGHGVWTAILCAAIWRDRRGSAVRLTWGVALAFGISVALHAAWDGVSFSGLPGVLVFAIYPVIGFVGLWILRFFIREAVERSRLVDAAPAPAPLAKALASYLVHPRRSPLAQPKLQSQPEMQQMPFVAAPLL